jgi:4-methyl-5(b-hydroxyethyl)-thiazole monophosphate biosynthesis
MMSDKKVLVPLLDGFEEIEAVTIIDVLRRAEVPVVVGGEQVGLVRGAHGIAIQTDAALADIDAGALRMVVLPGGMPGSANLAQHPRVQALLKEVAAADGYTCAICAAPMALATAGVHRGKTVTCYPGFQSQLEGGDFVEDRVVVDGKVATSRGPGTALEFALTLAGILAGEDAEVRLQEQMLVVRAESARRAS